MNAGLEVMNSSNNILIDSTYKNLALVDIKTVTFNQIGPNVGVGWGHLHYSGKNPVFALGDTNGGYVGAAWSSRSGDDYFVKLNCYPNTVPFCIVYIFDEPTTPAPGSGLTVWDASGQVVFSSDVSYLRPLDVTSISGLLANSGNWSGFSKDYSPPVAVVFCKAHCEMTGNPRLGSFSSFCLGVRVANGSVSFYSNTIQAISGGATPKLIAEGTTVLMVINRGAFS